MMPVSKFVERDTVRQTFATKVKVNHLLSGFEYSREFLISMQGWAWPDFLGKVNQVHWQRVGLHDDVGDNHVGDDDDDVDVDNGDDKEWKGQPRSLAEKCLHDFSLDQKFAMPIWQHPSTEPITD